MAEPGPDAGAPGGDDEAPRDHEAGSRSAERSERALAVGEGGFEFISHTADLGVRAWGVTLGGAFANAAYGMFKHICDPLGVEPVGAVALTVEAEDLEALLLEWLEELLFYHESELVVFRRFAAEVSEREGGGWELAGQAWGEAYDAARHGHIHEVKAVTYHGIAVTTDPAEVEVIVDI